MLETTAESSDLATTLELLDHSRQRFIEVAGHELRAPVSMVRELAESIADASEEEIRSTIAPALVRQAQRADQLLDDLLLASEIATSLPDGPFETVDVVAMAQAIWDSFEDAPTLELGGSHSEEVQVHEGTAERMLFHVLENAHRYGEPPFALTASSDDGRVVLEVSSAGAEVRTDDLVLAFELFYRGEGAVTTAPGFGLGLPVARALARREGGDVAISTRDGGGVVVRIELPSVS